ncbi:MAG: transcriptional repressor [Acidobacteriota bacterium]|nr:transcriptional repressor [Acidobacteriota bacterium]
MQNIEQMLVEHGVRPTIHRIHIARYILGEADHPTADEVLDWANQNLSKISRATVYNTLRELTQAGLIREFRFPQVSRTVYDKNTENHFHFYDQASDSFMDLNADSVKVDIQLPPSFKVNCVDILVSGNCSQ